MDLPQLSRMYDFYTQLLQIPDVDMQTVHWNTIVQKIVQLREETIPTQQLQSKTMPRLNAHDIVNRIMRKENYLIALFNKDVMDLRIPLPRFLLFGWGMF